MPATATAYSLSGQVFRIRDDLSPLTGERESFRGLRVEIVGFGGMAGDYTVRFLDSAETIVDILSSSEVEDERSPFWTVDRVNEHILDPSNRSEFDLSQLEAE